MSSAPKLQRLDHWTLVAKDLERTRTFYTEVLGATVLKRDGGPAAVVLANTIIDFFPANGESQPSPGAGQQHHAYVINLEDFDPWVEYFRQHQVPVHLTPHSWQAMSIYLDDPNGYHLEVSVLFENEEDGRREIEKRGLQPMG